MNKVRVGIVGAGNCASSLVQGVTYYADVADDAVIPGLMHPRIGAYHVGDIEFVVAFDVDATKVGVDLSQAIAAGANNTRTFAKVDHLGVEVLRGPTLDGFGRFYQETATESSAPAVDVAQVLKENAVDVLVSYLPVGSEEATKFYAEAALEAGCGFINCVPVFIASDPEWERRFKEAGLPIIGDDIKSQVGSTIIHRQLAKLFEDRGIELESTYQLNFGGNMDFMNMLERDRLMSKKVSKTQAVTSNVVQELAPDQVHIGPSDHVPWLTDRKWAYIRLEGNGFGGSPMSVEVKLEVWDSPNSAGVVVDAIRCCKLALDNGDGGALIGPASYFMKSPPTQYPDDIARQMTEEFINQAPRNPTPSRTAALNGRG